MRGVLGADDAACLADRRRRRRVDDACDARAGGGLHHRLGPVDVRAEHGFRVAHAHRVHAGHVEHRRRSRACRATSASSSKRSPRTGRPPHASTTSAASRGAGERSHLASVRDESAQERAADEPAAAGEEGGALHARLSLSSADQQAAEPREVLDGGAHRDRGRREHGVLDRGRAGPTARTCGRSRARSRGTARSL